MNLSAIDKQDLRHAVLQILYSRQVVPLAASSVNGAARRLVLCALELSDTLEAIDFHVGLGNVLKLTDEWGSEDMYKITSAGILAHERDTHKGG